jgi:hydrogenase maturation protease
MQTLVLGVGNPILTDDGVGIRAAELLSTQIKPRPDMVIDTAVLGGLALMEAMLGYERVILIDALLDPGGRPGTIRRMTLDELRARTPTEHSASPHDTGIVTALDLAAQMGLPVPVEVVIYAVTVDNVKDFGVEPTPAVSQALPTLLDALQNEIGGIDQVHAGDVGSSLHACNSHAYQ